MILMPQLYPPRAFFSGREGFYVTKRALVWSHILESTFNASWRAFLTCSHREASSKGVMNTQDKYIHTLERDAFHCIRTLAGCDRVLVMTKRRVVSSNPCASARLSLTLPLRHHRQEGEPWLRCLDHARFDIVDLGRLSIFLYIFIEWHGRAFYL